MKKEKVPVKRFVSAQGQEIFAFYEGDTDGNVCLKIGNILGLKERQGLDSDETDESESGKAAINRRMVNMLSPNLTKGSAIRCLILRDLDMHEQETEARICQSITSVWQSAFEERNITGHRLNLTPVPDRPNVYTLSISSLNFWLALHVATRRWNNSFIKSTIDDYVLELALRQNTATELAKKVSIPPDRLIAKITEEIPALLRANANGADDLTEAKDYVRLYAAVVKSATSPAVFAERTMAKAQEGDIREVFQPLIAAFEFVGSE